MNIDSKKIESIRDNSIRAYKKYINSFGIPNEGDIINLDTIILVGYFLITYSLNPEDAVRSYIRRYNITSKKANEVKMLIRLMNN